MQIIRLDGCLFSIKRVNNGVEFFVALVLETSVFNCKNILLSWRNSPNYLVANDFWLVITDLVRGDHPAKYMIFDLRTS